jgi:hypothetical protein
VLTLGDSSLRRVKGLGPHPKYFFRRTNVVWVRNRVLLSLTVVWLRLLINWLEQIMLKRRYRQSGTGANFVVLYISITHICQFQFRQSTICNLRCTCQRAQHSHLISTEYNMYVKIEHVCGSFFLVLIRKIVPPAPVNPIKWSYVLDVFSRTVQSRDTIGMKSVCHYSSHDSIWRERSSGSEAVTSNWCLFWRLTWKSLTLDLM